MDKSASIFQHSVIDSWYLKEQKQVGYHQKTQYRYRDYIKTEYKYWYFKEYYQNS